MINSKETLKKLHQALPNLTLDELFIILDCYTEEYVYTTKSIELPKVWYDTTTTTGIEAVPCTSKIQNAIDGPYINKYGGSNENISIATRKPGQKLAVHY